jgi:ABC-2 type transport system ATP-binding protein
MASAHPENMALAFDHLAKSYGDTTALADLSLEVASGELFGLIGPDGAGKTTLMRIACGLILANKGSVRTLDVDPIRQGKQVKDSIGYMPQRFSLYPDLTVEENLRFFADLYLVPQAERREREARLMQFSHLEPFRKRRAGQLSGGMKQKLALSCTLIHTPKLLILDEPTTGVDPVSRREFWEILKDLNRQGITILVSTPYMDEALLCDRVALMHHGRAIAIGKPAEIASLCRYNLLEIIGDDLTAIQKKLNELSLSGVSVYRYGDRLHVAYQSRDDLAKIQQLTESLGLKAMDCQATIEDTFVALISDSSRGEDAA